jgi:hypothetical protein
MAICNSLNGLTRQHVDFDPANPEHLRAFSMLVLGENGPSSIIRQHPSLRFNLEHPYDNVRSLMIYKVAEAHIKNHKLS